METVKMTVKMKKTVTILAFAVNLLAGSASAAMTIDTRAEALKEFLPDNTPVKLEIASDGQLVIALSANIADGLPLPADLGPATIDLNGWTIRGTNGANGTTVTAGTNGGAAITVGGECGAKAGPTAITLRTSSITTVDTDENGFDTTPEGTSSSTTYVPGDYCIINLETGETTIQRNVMDPTIFNVDEYKTTKMVFRYVPEGKFKAKTSYYTTEAYNDTTLYDMELSAYWIGLFELTEAQYNMLPVPTNKAKPGTGSMKPLYFTRWLMNTNIVGLVKNGKRDLSKTYLGALNAKIATSEFANKIDICTQCQWERAARAGTRSDYFFADEPFTSTAVSDELKTYGWYTQSDYNAYGGSGTRECQKVGLLRPNPWGLWDIYGNAPEICIDFAKLLPTSFHKDWVEETSDNYRVVRGGYFGSEKPKSLSSVIRSRTQYEHGCRLVINAELPVFCGKLVGGNGGDGNPAGKGSPVIAYADGTEITPTVIGDNVTLIPGIDGKELRESGPLSLWITDHADAGSEKVHLAFQPIFNKPVDMSAWITYARENGLIHYVAADTEAELANAPLKDDFTFRGGDGMKDVAKGWCWITVPATNRLYKIVICGNEQ